MPGLGVVTALLDILASPPDEVVDELESGCDAPAKLSFGYSKAKMYLKHAYGSRFELQISNPTSEIAS